MRDLTSMTLNSEPSLQALTELAGVNPFPCRTQEGRLDIDCMMRAQVA